MSDSEYEEANIVHSVDAKHKTGNYKFNGSTLEFGGHNFEQNLGSYLPQPPILTKRGQVAKRQPPPPPKKLVTWWKAQCLFRGLEGKGSIAELQDRLKGHENDGIIKDLQDLTASSKAIFKAKNKEARELRWLYDMTDDQKAHYDTQRFLKEKYVMGGTSKDIVVLRAYYPEQVKSFADDMGLECEWTDKPIEKGDLVMNGMKLAVVGQDISTIKEKIKSIAREAEQIKLQFKLTQEAQERKIKKMKEKKRQELSEALEKCEDWDVTGTWLIDCPHIEEQWSDVGKLWMTVFCEQTKKGAQMFAKFSFGVITGVMRFERQPNDQRTASSTSKKRKADALEEDSDSEEHDDYLYGGRRSPTPETFYFGYTTKPTARYASWNYRWRGEETGESELEPGSDSKAYSITFSGPKVRTLKGTIGSTYFGSEGVEFTGVKVGVGGQRDININLEWHGRNRYEYRYGCTWGPNGSKPGPVL